MTLAAARCEEALNNPTGETEKVVKAAQLFMDAEMEATNVDFAGFEENLMEAVDCYELAIDVLHTSQMFNLSHSPLSEMPLLIPSQLFAVVSSPTRSFCAR